MINLKTKEQLTENEKRDLHMLYYDGYKRYSVSFPTKYTTQETMQFEEYSDALIAIRDNYNQTVKDNPSIGTIINEDAGYDNVYDIFDNLSREDVEISIAELNKVALIKSIL